MLLMGSLILICSSFVDNFLKILEIFISCVLSYHFQMRCLSVDLTENVVGPFDLKAQIPSTLDFVCIYHLDDFLCF